MQQAIGNSYSTKEDGFSTRNRYNWSLIKYTIIYIYIYYTDNRKYMSFERDILNGYGYMQAKYQVII